jgi:hypothetical protein
MHLNDSDDRGRRDVQPQSAPDEQQSPAPDPHHPPLHPDESQEPDSEVHELLFIAPKRPVRPKD